MANGTFPIIHVRTSRQRAEAAKALLDRVGMVMLGDDTVFGMSNPQPPADPTLSEQVSNRMAEAHRRRAPEGAALEGKLQTLVAQQRHERYRTVFRTVD